MAGQIARLRLDCAIDYAETVIGELRASSNWAELRVTMAEITADMGFRHFALLTHEDLREPGPGKIDLRDYPEGASARIIDGCQYRRDPVMRGCVFADGAFLWTKLGEIIAINHHDRIAFELGRREGLDEGVTIPCGKLGRCLGSCTFAGLKQDHRVESLLGPAQMIGIFAFQSARRIAGDVMTKAPPPRLEPRLRDCVVLAGQGLGDKVIAHRMGLTTRTVESYLRDARRLFAARDRTELVTAALLAGEVSLSEVRSSQAP